jgi:chemosensory pili system protein ChpA (sensor histidine kinase/response regulator)
VQQELMRIRAVPFSNLNERLYRIVPPDGARARQEGRPRHRGLRGSSSDRSVLERIGAPLEHMLRNALAHGLEMPAARVAAGKPETGKISITLRQEANEIALVLSDDGAGLDLDKLKEEGPSRWASSRPIPSPPRRCWRSSFSSRASRPRSR